MNLFVNEQKNEARINEKIGTYIRNFFPEKFRGKLWKFVTKILISASWKWLETYKIALLENLRNPSTSSSFSYRRVAAFDKLINNYILDSDLKRTF